MKNENISNSITWVIKAMEQYDPNIYFDDGLQNEPPVDEDIQSTIVQAVRELLFNAVKYAESNKAHIKLSFPGSFVKVTVEDDGVGFDPKDIEFTPAEDRGFGLFHIKERMDVLGGQTKIESIPDGGTKITLMVPLEGDGKEQTDGGQIAGEEQEQQDSAAEESSSKIKVLLVDDHDMMRDGLRRIIESENDLTVIAEAPDAESAIDAVDDAKPDVVIMEANELK